MMDVIRLLQLSGRALPVADGQTLLVAPGAKVTTIDFDVPEQYVLTISNLFQPFGLLTDILKNDKIIAKSAPAFATFAIDWWFGPDTNFRVEVTNTSATAQNVITFFFGNLYPLRDIEQVLAAQGREALRDFVMEGLA